MLIMETIAKIRRLHYGNKLGIKAIAKKLNISINTVRKIIRSDKVEFAYQRQKSAYRVLEKYVKSLLEKLEHDKGEPSRRKRTIKKLFIELSEAGYSGSYDAVHAFVTQWRKTQHRVSARQAFVPLSYEAGESFQFDWSEEEIELAGTLTRIKLAQFRLCYSRHFFLIAYPNEQLEMVLDAHNQAFKFFNGVCRKGIYDNMKTAVKAILTGKDRIFNPRFLLMCSHHAFEPIACTPAAGWEKGQVENQVLLARRNFFTPLVKVDSLERLNQHLEKACLAWSESHYHPEQKLKTLLAVYQTELATFTPYRGDFDDYKVKEEVVSPYCFVRYLTNCYSVEADYVGQLVQVRVYANEITIFFKDKIIGKHKRCFGQHQRIYDPWHYISVLEYKPGALRNGAPFKQLDLPVPLKKIRETLLCLADGDKRFIRILLAIKQYGLSAVEQACLQALAQGGCNDTMVLRYLEPVVMNEANLTCLQLRDEPSENCATYNEIFLKANKEVKEAAHGA